MQAVGLDAARSGAPVPTPPHVPRQEAPCPRTLGFWGAPLGRSSQSLAISARINLQLPPLLGRCGWGSKFQPSRYRVVPLLSAPSWRLSRGFPKTSSLTSVQVWPKGA